MSWSGNWEIKTHVLHGVEKEGNPSLLRADIQRENGIRGCFVEKSSKPGTIGKEDVVYSS